jgi:HK97 family phage major capsid protein
MPNLNEMRESYASLTNRITELQNQDAKTGDAAVELDNALTEIERLAADIERQERFEAVQNKMGEPQRKTALPGATAKKKASAFEDDNQWFRAVADVALRNQIDPRLLRNAGGDVFQEAQGADGGFLLPVDKRSLQSLLVTPEAICGKTDILLTPSNAVTIPVDDDPAWSTAAGAADVSEGATLTEGKVQFKSLTLSLVKKGVLVRVTSEMLEDGTNIGPYVLGKTAQKLSWSLDKVCFAAFLASGAKIEIAKTVGAAAGSAPDILNVQAMWVKMLIQHRSNAVWLANPQLETALQKMYVTGASSGVFPVYIPAGGLSEAPYAKLYGRPIIFSELCPAVGTTGDLMLVDPTSFFCVMKSGGPRTDVSIHSEFVKDVVAYRSYVRVVCASKFSAAITRGDGTTAGNVITVGTRA